MDNGYIKVYRSLMKKGYYRDSEYVHLWIHLLFKANYQDQEYLFNGKIHHLKPGQFITGRNTLVKETGINRSKIERILKTLIFEHQIEQQTFSKFRIITISNWSEYQISEQVSEQRVSSKRAQLKKEKNIKEYNVGNPDDLSDAPKSSHKDKKIWAPDSTEYMLANYLFECITDNSPKESRIHSLNNGRREATIQSWSAVMDKMLRIDKLRRKSIAEVIAWATSHEFWSRNILSAGKLREKWDVLIMQKQRGK